MRTRCHVSIFKTLTVAVRGKMKRIKGFVKLINQCLHTGDELCHHVHICLDQRLILGDDSSGNRKVKFSLNGLVQTWRGGRKKITFYVKIQSKSKCCTS